MCLNSRHKSLEIREGCGQWSPHLFVTLDFSTRANLSYIY